MSGNKVEVLNKELRIEASSQNLESNIPMSEYDLKNIDSIPATTQVLEPSEPYGQSMTFLENIITLVG